MSLIVDIKKRTGNFRLHVSFETEGGVHALLGSSGSGKSMTLKCIAGILTPDEGYIALDGKVLYDSGQTTGKKINLPPQKRSVGYMFQDYALFPTMTVLQNVMEGMGKQRDKENAQELLRRFHVLELADRFHTERRDGDDNEVILQKPSVMEDLFEWNVSFRPENVMRNAAGGPLADGNDAAGQAMESPLLWRTAKTGEELRIPDRLFFSSQDVMLLRE